MKTITSHKLGLTLAGVLVLPRDAASLSFPDADSRSIRPRCGGRESKFLAVSAALVALVLGFGMAARAGDWSAAGSLTTARDDHTATLLPSGKVLVAGGYNGGYLASAELYDPATNTWSPAGSLTTARDDHTATLLPSGKVLVVGGLYYDGSFHFLASARLYDPATNAWSAAGGLAAGRYFHTATLLPSGKVLVAGGYNDSSGYLASAELYDPATNVWSAAGSLATARLEHTATLLPNGKVLVAGGYNDGSGSLASAELYDPATNAWSIAGSLATARRFHTAALLPGGRVLVVGGTPYGGNSTASAELYDPATNAWSAAGSLATARYYQTSALLADGKVLVAGGYDGNGGVRLASAELYDPATNAWSAAGSLAAARYGHTATLLPSGEVLVAGGNNDGGVRLATAELYTEPPDMTLAPTLTDPATGSTHALLVAVSYSLPEAASNGTVKLTFTGPVVTTATLVNAQGTAGAHSFTLPSSDLASSANVASVSGPNALSDGVYSVTLQYQDALGNPAASATATNVTVYNDTDGDGILDRYETGTGIYVSPEDTGTSPTNPDSDGDGLNDGQEVNTYHCNPNIKDTDGDGFDDGFEVSTGFNPTSATSTPDAQSSIRTAAEYRFNAALGISYRIEASTDLTNWQTIEDNIIGAGGVITRFYSIEGQPKRFFRSRRN